MSDLIDSYLGSYQLKAIIRHGGMATIYKAYQASLDRYVAVKVMFDNHDPQFAPRFRREARAVAQLQHPNIVQIYEYGEQQGLFFLAMQFVEHSVTLTDLLGKPVPPVDALRIVARVLDALAYAHGRNVIHRDIKPGNILLAADNWPMLIDFGIAKLIGDNLNLTLPGTAIGTPAYMAPEQAEGRAVDARSDLYAMGVVLYEMVTGRVPFDADTPMAVLMKHVYEAPPPPQSLNPALPPPLTAALLRALQKKPADRYQSASEMSADLTRLATQLEQANARANVDSLYAAAVQAFEEGRWGAAVDQLNQLVALDANYEDSAALLEAAREAQERTRQDAKERLTLVRQRQMRAAQAANSQPSLAAPAGPPTPPPLTAPITPAAQQPRDPTPRPAAPPTTRLDIADMPSPPPVATGVATNGMGATDAGPAPAKKRAGVLPWVVAGIVGVVALGLIAGWATGLLGGAAVAVRPTSGAPTAAASAVAAAPTASAEPAPTAEPTAGADATPAEPTAAAPTAAPLAEPAGELVFEDDFNAGASRSGLEDQVRDPTFSRGFHDPGHYHFKLSGTNETRWVLLPRLAFSSFSMQIDVWDNSDSFAGSVSQGVIFRVLDNNHFYALLLDPRNGRYTVRKLAGKDSWSDMIPWKDSPLIKRSNEINHLRLDGDGDTFTISLNDAPLDTFSDGDYGFGMLGLIVANEDATTPHMHFDNLKIWSADTAAAPTLPLLRKDARAEMVLIPEGPFIMGGNERADEWAHLVTLPNFYIDRSEVTNEAYATCVKDGKCTPQQANSSQSHPNYGTEATYAKYPVIQISWQQAQAYCGWAGKRLPTEAEWEKAASWNAARNQKLVWPWEGDFDAARLNSAEANNGDTTAVGQFPAEINNTLDMGGNVSEWTSSLYLPYPYNADDGREDSAAAGDRVFRGGSWAQTEGKAKGIYRQGAAPTYFGREIGFRCAATP